MMMLANISLPKNYCKWTVLFFVGFIFSIHEVHAQAEPLRAKYKIVVKNGDMDGVMVVIERDGKKWKQHTGADDKGFIDMEYGHEFVISYSKPGYITKKIAVS